MSTKVAFKYLDSSIGKSVASEGSISISDVHVIFTLNIIPGNHFLNSINFFLSHFPVLISKCSIHGSMSIKLFFLLGSDSAFKKKGWTVLTMISVNELQYLQLLVAKVLNLKRDLQQGLQWQEALKIWYSEWSHQSLSKD